jgi:hypothetical protein
MIEYTEQNINRNILRCKKAGYENCYDAQIKRILGGKQNGGNRYARLD